MQPQHKAIGPPRKPSQLPRTRRVREQFYLLPVIHDYLLSFVYMKEASSISDAAERLLRDALQADSKKEQRLAVVAEQRPPSTG